jgi:hypothetical protein
MPLTNVSGSCHFLNDLQDANKKLIFKKFFCLLLFEGTFTSFFKDKKSKRSHKAVVLLGDRRIQEAQKHTDPTDPDSDPQHCQNGTGKYSKFCFYENGNTRLSPTSQNSQRPQSLAMRWGSSDPT